LIKRQKDKEVYEVAKRIKAYIAYIDELLKSDDRDFDEEINRHLKQIAFFAHERLIHLIVTVLFALMTIMCCLAFIVTEKIQIFILTIAMLVLLIPYIKHYYLMENSVQKMYEQYDLMMEKSGKKAFKRPEE
jgi:ABC-type proline/glycine betaine transport system permease subunit